MAQMGIVTVTSRGIEELVGREVVLSGGPRVVFGTLEALDRDYRFALLGGQWFNLDHWSSISVDEDA